MKGKPRARYRRVEGLPFQRLGEEMLVVAPRARDVHMLSPTAASVWELLEQPVEEEEIVERLMEGYDVTKSRARKDVAALIEDLVGKGLVERI